MKIVVYEVENKKICSRIKDITNIEAELSEYFSNKYDEILTDNRNISVLVYENSRLRLDLPPSCWKTDMEGNIERLLVGNVIFCKKKAPRKYSGLSERDIAYICTHYRPYDFCIV